MKSLRTLKKTRARASTTAGSHQQKLHILPLAETMKPVAEVFGNHKIRPTKVQCVASP